MSWLGKDGKSASLLSTAHRLLAVQDQINALLPEPLRSACRVLRLEEGKLTLGVPAASHSAKLRQLAPRIVTALEKQGWQVNGIAVRVQATLNHPLGTNPSDRLARSTPPNLLGSRGIQAFSELRDHLRDGPLAQAITRLLDRRKDE